VEKFDHLSTTAVVTYVRRHVTPAMLWSAIGALVTCLVVSITWLVNTQSDIHQLKDTVAESKRSVADMQQKLDVIHNIETKLEGIAHDVANIKEEVDRHQGEWDRIHGIAESPPHARRRH
jgi:peptidoglycan hydrolase CwlO-like protein